MSKLITREAFKVALQAIKDFVEKKLKAFSSDVHNIVNTEIESATKELATKSELNKKVNQDSYAQDNNVAIFRHGENSVDLLDSGYSIGDHNLGELKYAYPVTGDGYYNTSTEIYGYASSPSWNESDYFIYQDIQLSVPIAKIVASAPWSMQYFSIPGDINSSHTGSYIIVSAARLAPVFVERFISTSTIATEKGVEEFVATTIIPEIDLVKDTLLKTIHVKNSSTVLIEGNTRVILDTSVSSSITFDFEASEKEIIIIFTAGENCSCLFTQPIVWQNDNVPTWEVGKTYEISIFNNLAVYTSYVV